MTLTEVKHKLLQCNELPGDKAFGLLNLHRKQPSTDDIKNARKAAVSIIFHTIKDEVFILLIKRTPSKGVHSAQMAFPGGKQEKEDANEMECAIRETKEEIGLNLMHYQKSCKKLSAIFIPPSNFLVQAYAFFVENIGTLNLQSSEVQSVHNLPISSITNKPFLSPYTIDYPGGKLKVNGIAIDNEIIWGATAGMLAELHLILA